MAMLNYQRVMVIFGFRYKKLSSSSWGSANWVHARKKAQNCSKHRFSAAKKSLKVSGPKYGPASCSAATSLSASSQRLLPFATMKCGKQSVMAQIFSEELSGHGLLESFFFLRGLSSREDLSGKLSSTSFDGSDAFHHLWSTAKPTTMATEHNP